MSDQKKTVIPVSGDSVTLPAPQPEPAETPAPPPKKGKSSEPKEG